MCSRAVPGVAGGAGAGEQRLRGPSVLRGSGAVSSRWPWRCLAPAVRADMAAGTTAGSEDAL